MSLDRAFGHLRPDERAILDRHHFVGYPPSQIAGPARRTPEERFARDFTMHIAPCAALDAEARVSIVEAPW